MALAALSSSLSVGLDVMDSQEFLEFFKSRNFGYTLFVQLETKMKACSLIVDDAEEKQFLNEGVRKWLLELKDATYEAEDLLDGIQIEYQAHQAIKEDQERPSSSQDRLTEVLVPELLKILERLEDLIQDSAAFGLSKALGAKRSSEKRETTSLVDEFDEVYGRDADKKAIIDLLISDDDNGRNRLGVIPIVGRAGVGKTHLARHVYNDKAVKEQFKIRAWVCVAEQFDVTKVAKEIVEKVTGKACHYNDLDQLQHKLKVALDGKKFLLVLDDIWSLKYEKWSKLLTPLRSRAKGSTLIITTRLETVASMVQTVPTHQLWVLDDEDCWKLFAAHARLDGNSAANPPELQEIAEKIVRKCRGLPLAAKALGEVLRCQTKVEKWKEVLKSEIWDVQIANILPALAMSYIHLPSHLKRCFAYCAMFPQDYEFKKEELVALWMSEGFLVQQRGNQSLEVGDMYFDDLVSRSFFQHSSNVRGELCFVMQGLMRDLARFVSGKFCFWLGGKTSWKISKRTRHSAYERNIGDVPMKFHGIRGTPFLRSFVLAQKSQFHCGHWRPIRCFDKEDIDGLLSTQELLRVLSLSCYEIRELPNSIGNLKHMRHLDLSYTSIIVLPEAVTDLFNLETLILRGCNELVRLPADMLRLFNLCQLDLEGTKKLMGMPPEMGKLKKLSKLSDFVVGENGGSGIQELGNFHYLRGQISIRGLENVKDDWGASEAILEDKENLKVLNLSWKGNADDSRQVEQLLERLQPHIHIESIKIRGYGGMEFPNWVGGISFSKLKKFDLDGCKKCIRLPPLGQLASLEELSIDGGYDAVLEAIGLEFYGMSKPGEKPFSSLKRLKFIGMLNWREWSSFNGAFPVLEELKLHNCPKLKSVPDRLRSLKRLRIEDCGELNFENLLSSACGTLETISISGSEKVKYLSLENFFNLKVLEIWNCSNVESLGSTAAATTITRTSDPLSSPSLTSLHIAGCSKLEFLVRGGLSAPNLMKLQLHDCCNLKLLPQHMDSLLPSLEKLVISGCPKIESFPVGGLPSGLQSLEIKSCEKLVSGRMQWGLQSLPSLSNILIGGGSFEDMESSFPEEKLLPSSLQSLGIKCFAKMKSLNYKGLQHLFSLQSLRIEGCEDLESLPEEGLPFFVSSLHILGCPLLKQRCEREIGVDWPKIMHIPHLFIPKITNS